MSSAVTLADLLHQLGDVSPRRIRASPPPGSATEQDVLRLLHAADKRLYELVDGVLVEKVMGIIESSLACDLIKVLGNFLDEHPLGFLAGPDGAVRLMPGLVRIPDVSFISWQQLGSRKRPTRPIPHLAPVLAIEVLSKGNTGAEMNRKVRDYFLSGVRQVWFVNPRRRTVQVFTAPDESVVHTEDEVLDGGDVLPGLALPLRHIFVGVPRRSGRSTRRGNGGRPRNPREK